MAEKKKKSGDRKIAKNSKAFHDYFVEDSYEAGHRTGGHGGEVHSHGQREPEGLLLHHQGRADVRSTECTSAPMRRATSSTSEPRRPRRLLMHKREIQRLFAKIKQDGYTLIPLTRVFQRTPGEGGGRPVQGQKAL